MSRYAILWTLKPESYYQKMTAIGPMFGGTSQTAAKFDTEQDARGVLVLFPVVAMIGSRVVILDEAN